MVSLVMPFCKYNVVVLVLCVAKALKICMHTVIYMNRCTESWNIERAGTHNPIQEEETEHRN